MSQSKAAPRPQAGLPYINNLPLVLITVGINLLMAFVFFFGQEITFERFWLDAVVCAVTSTIICVVFVYLMVNRRRRQGALPREVPQSPLTQRLPKNPALFILIVAIVCALLMALVATVVVRFFEIQTYTFARFVVWKVIYSFVLSAKLIELAILRFVQPDCAPENAPAQTGSETVKDPLPRRETFLNLFNTVVNDFGFNMLVGLLLGGTVVYEKNVVIAPTTRSGIIVGGLVLGVILTLRMVRPVFKSISNLRDAGGLPPLEKRNPLVAWLPAKPTGFALALMPLIMVISAAVLWAALTFFGFETLNFFQYFIVRTLYVTLLTKPVVLLAVLRLRQPPKSNAAASAAP